MAMFSEPKFDHECLKFKKVTPATISAKNMKTLVIMGRGIHDVIFLDNWPSLKKIWYFNILNWESMRNTKNLEDGLSYI